MHAADFDLVSLCFELTDGEVTAYDAGVVMLEQCLDLLAQQDHRHVILEKLHISG